MKRKNNRMINLSESSLHRLVRALLREVNDPDDDPDVVMEIAAETYEEYKDAPYWHYDIEDYQAWARDYFGEDPRAMRFVNDWYAGKKDPNERRAVTMDFQDWIEQRSS